MHLEDGERNVEKTGQMSSSEQMEEVILQISMRCWYVGRGSKFHQKTKLLEMIHSRRPQFLL